MKPFTRLDLIQGSDEWKAARFDYVSASNVSCLFGENPYKTALQYAEELISKVEIDQSVGKEIVFHQGRIAEGAGRDWVESNLGLRFEPVVLVSTRIPELLASLDGFDEEKNLILECKYVGREPLSDVKRGVLKPDHMIQVQVQLLVSGAEKAIYFAIDPDENAAYCEVYPDPKLFSEIEEKVRAFVENLKQGILPEASPRDVKQVDDPRFETLASLHLAAKSAKQQYDALEAELLEEYEKHGRIKAGSVSVTRFFSKGTVDYKKVPELKGVDLERYRKPGSIKTRVTIKESA